MSSTTKDTQHHHHYRIGDQVTVKGFVTHHQELMGRNGIVTGSQTSSGKYPVCLESTDSMEGSVVLLSRKHIKKRARLHHHEHRHIENNKEPEAEVRAFAYSTPIPASCPTAADSSPVNIAMSAPPVQYHQAPEAALAPDSPSAVIIHKTPDSPTPTASTSQTNNSTVVVENARGGNGNCCFITWSIICSIIAVVCAVMAIVSLGLLWWLWIPVIICGILSCVFCCLICCHKDDGGCAC